jgi:hypothetical protein
MDPNVSPLARRNSVRVTFVKVMRMLGDGRAGGTRTASGDTVVPTFGPFDRLSTLVAQRSDVARKDGDVGPRKERIPPVVNNASNPGAREGRLTRSLVACVHRGALDLHGQDCMPVPSPPQKPNKHLGDLLGLESAVVARTLSCEKSDSPVCQRTLRSRRIKWALLKVHEILSAILSTKHGSPKSISVSRQILRLWFNSSWRD